MKARITQLGTACFSAAAVLMFSAPIAAQAAVPGSAEGDSYAAYGQVFVPLALGSGPLRVGPISPARAAIPPGSDPQSASNSVLDFDDTSQNLVHIIQAAASNAKATLGNSATTNCWLPDQTVPLATPPFNTGPLTGGNACSHVAGVELLPQTGAVPLVVANGIDVQSITQSCTATPVGAANFVNVSVAGIAVQVPVAPNTEIDVPGVAHVILNEQIYDHQGHGLTVNGVHVFLDSTVSTLAGADVIAAHAHSMAFCSDTSTTDTGTLPCLGGSCQRPVVTKTDSTKHANPGETVTYTVKIDSNTCNVTSVTDVLPNGFHFISASGDLGVPTKVDVLADGQEQLFWSLGGTAFGSTPIETITVTIDPKEPAGQYTNLVIGTSDCGSFAGSDLLPLTSGPPANQGGNPGIIVPRPGAAAPSPAPTRTPAASPSPVAGTQAATTKLPFTGTIVPDGSVWLGVILLGLVLSAAAATRVLREGPID